MRTYLAIFSLLFIPYLTAAQDPGTLAAQQEQIAADQANQMAMQAAQQAAQAAAQNSDLFPLQPCCIAWTAPPQFSVKSGKYPAPTTVKITDATRGAIIYYTTDGWTPTANSTRYRGPIPIDSTTNLQAIAISPYAARSIVTSAQYEIAGSTANSSAAFTAAPANASANGTPVPLVFAADVSSKTASIGDQISLTLTEDVSVGNGVIKKGATATATVTAVDPAGAGGAPGVLSFEVDSLQSAIGPITPRRRDKRGSSQTTECCGADSRRRTVHGIQARKRRADFQRHSVRRIPPAKHVANRSSLITTPT